VAWNVASRSRTVPTSCLARFQQMSFILCAADVTKSSGQEYLQSSSGFPLVENTDQRHTQSFVLPLHSVELHGGREPAVSRLHFIMSEVTISKESGRFDKAISSNFRVLESWYVLRHTRYSRYKKHRWGSRFALYKANHHIVFVLRSRLVETTPPNYKMLCSKHRSSSIGVVIRPRSS
jgi:hypothetical protein